MTYDSIPHPGRDSFSPKSPAGALGPGTSNRIEAPTQHACTSRANHTRCQPRAFPADQSARIRRRLTHCWLSNMAAPAAPIFGEDTYPAITAARQAS